MPSANRIKFGESVEDREKKEAARLRELEAQVQADSQERQQKMQRYIKSSKTKRIIVILIFTLLSIALLVFGTYNTFFKQETDMISILQYVNQNQRDTAFISSGVEGFLKENINVIFRDYFSINDNNIEYYRIDEDSLYVTDIVEKNRSYANVYFKARIDTKYRDEIGDNDVIIPGEEFSTWYSFYIPVYFDQDNDFYQPAGKLQVLAWNIDNKATLYTSGDENILDNPFLDWSSDVEEYELSETERVKQFLDGFFQDLFNNRNKDLNNGQVYQGTEFITAPEELSYETISDLHYYTVNNVDGFNVKCTYILKTADGLRITNQVYLKIRNDGASYIIEKIR